MDQRYASANLANALPSQSQAPQAPTLACICIRLDVWSLIQAMHSHSVDQSLPLSASWKCETIFEYFEKYICP